jgi:hypothetical protein
MANTNLEITQCPAIPLILFYETMSFARKEHYGGLECVLMDIRLPVYYSAMKIAAVNNMIFKALSDGILLEHK